jgi:rubrerythrin
MMAKTHHFDVSLAEKYGLVESILLSNLCWWIEKNEKNSKHYFNGRYWVYNSIEAFKNLFPYLTGDRIRRTIEKLRAQKALYVGKYNKIGYDRTLWYSVSDEVMALYSGKYEIEAEENPEKGSELGKNNGKEPDFPKLPNGQYDLAPVPNGNDQMGNTDGKEPDFPKLPNGQYDLAPVPNGNDQTGNTDGKEPDFPKLPNGQYDLAPVPNGNDQTGNTIWHPRQMDLAPVPNRFGASAKPIPDINLYKTDAAAMPEKEAAATSFFQKITKEAIRETLRGLDRELVFDSVFYKKAEEYMNKECLDLNYLEWIYRESLVRKPENLRGMYYALTFKIDLTEIYKDGRAEEQKSLMVCPVCGNEHKKTDYVCPGCNFLREDIQNGEKVYFSRQLYHLDEASKEKYMYELSEIYKTWHGEELAERRKRLEKKYHLVE